jgi:hypothetical protein
MAEFEPHENPILKSGPKLLFAFLERGGKGEYAGARRDSARKRIILKLIVECLTHSQFDILTQDISFAHKQPLAALYKLNMVSRHRV